MGAAVEHRADLHRRGVRAQHDAAVLGADEEGVHRARRVVRPDVERVEVGPLGLDLGTLRDLPAHRDEDVLDALHDRGERVPGAGGAAVVGQRDVDNLLDQDARVALLLELDLAALERLADPAAGLADALARLCALACGGSAPISRLASASAAVAGVGEPASLKRVEVGRRGDPAARASATAVSTLSWLSAATSTGRTTCWGGHAVSSCTGPSTDGRHGSGDRGADLRRGGDGAVSAVVGRGRDEASVRGSEVMTRGSRGPAYAVSVERPQQPGRDRCCSSA